MIELWKPIPGYEGMYSVSSLGNVRGEERTVTHNGRWGVTTRKLRAKHIAQKLDTNGYPTVRLCREGCGTFYRVHSLMLKAFVGPRPAGAHGRHLDDDKSNNILSNLAWGTALDNSRDMYLNGGSNQHVGKTHCIRGHELIPENVYENFRRGRSCKLCARIRASRNRRPQFDPTDGGAA